MVGGQSRRDHRSLDEVARGLTDDLPLLPRGRSYAHPSWQQRYPQLLWMLALVPSIGYLAIFFFQPIALFFAQSLNPPHLSLDNYRQAFATPTYLRIIWDTLSLSLIVAVITLVIGYPVAFCMTQARRSWQVVLWGMVMLPFWTSVLVRSYAWIVILRVRGVFDSIVTALHLPWHPHLLYNETGVVIGMVHVLLPYMVLTLFGAMRSIDLRYVKAAQNLGAPPAVAFWRVYVPLSVPGITSGFLVVFILAIGFYITPALLGGGNVLMISIQIAEQINELVNWGFGAALSVVLTATVLIVVVLFLRAFDVEAFGLRSAPAHKRIVQPAQSSVEPDAYGLMPATFAGSDSLSIPKERHYARPPLEWRWKLTVGITALACLFLVLPILIVAAMSFGTTSYLAFPPHGFSLQWYTSFFASRRWMAAAAVSVQAAALTAAMSLILGGLGALVFVRAHFRAKPALYVASLLPLMVPVIVTAVAMYFLFARLHLIGNVWAFAFADTVLATPTVLLIVSAAFRNVDVTLERAAATLGAHPARAFIAVTLPLVAPALAAGALFAFITSFDESVIALFLSSVSTSTLPKVMWDSLRFQIDPTISAISTLLVALTVTVLGLGAVFLGRTSQSTAAKV
jgi:putative spermidine/putrescine transport system permease protein